MLNKNYILSSLRWITRKRKVDGPIIMLDFFFRFQNFLISNTKDLVKKQVLSNFITWAVTVVENAK